MKKEYIAPNIKTLYVNDDESLLQSSLEVKNQEEDGPKAFSRPNIVPSYSAWGDSEEEE